MLPEGYELRLLHASDAEALAAAYLRNADHLAPWEPARAPSFFTPGGQASAIAAQLDQSRSGHLAAWLVVHDGQVVGRINLNNIVRGVLCSASVGYWVDASHLGRGVASGALEEVCVQALERGLHRLEAGTQLHNSASQRVLERSGFALFGVAPKLLFIAGAWQDHRLYQRVLHDRPL